MKLTRTQRTVCEVWRKTSCQRNLYCYFMFACLLYC